MTRDLIAATTEGRKAKASLMEGLLGPTAIKEASQTLGTVAKQVYRGTGIKSRQRASSSLQSAFNRVLVAQGVRPTCVRLNGGSQYYINLPLPADFDRLTAHLTPFEKDFLTMCTEKAYDKEAKMVRAYTRRRALFRRIGSKFNAQPRKRSFIGKLMGATQ